MGEMIRRTAPLAFAEIINEMAASMILILAVFLQLSHLLSKNYSSAFLDRIVSL